MATQGNGAQFSYDFAVTVAKGTINKLAKLSGAALTLASAYYSLKNSAAEYIGTLRENTLRFGGMLSTMKAMEQAQNRLISGQSYFNVDDQLKGMNKLMSVGINVGKELNWINKAAHATGKSFSDFSGMITSAINGNLQSLVDAGLMTQRATKMFEKFQGNTIQMQAAIMRFLKQHKGLASAIQNDFSTVQDQTNRLKGVMSSFWLSIIGKPNNPGGLYGTVVKVFKGFADAFARNSGAIKKYGEGVGVVLSWVVSTIGKTVMWLGRQAKKAAQILLGSSDNFVERMRSLVVWLEFWRLKIVDFFNEYGGLIKKIIKYVLWYKAIKIAFSIGDGIIGSVYRYADAIRYSFKMFKSGYKLIGAFRPKWLAAFKSFRWFLPKWIRGLWDSIWNVVGITTKKGGLFSKLFGASGRLGKLIFGIFMNIPKILLAGFNKLRLGKIFSLFNVFKHFPKILGLCKFAFKGLFSIFKASNPLGWVFLAYEAFELLYEHCEAFRDIMDSTLDSILKKFKLINSFVAKTKSIGNIKNATDEESLSKRYLTSAVTDKQRAAKAADIKDKLGMSFGQEYDEQLKAYRQLSDKEVIQKWGDTALSRNLETWKATAILTKQQTERLNELISKKDKQGIKDFMNMYHGALFAKDVVTIDKNREKKRKEFEELKRKKEAMDREVETPIPKNPLIDTAGYSTGEAVSSTALTFNNGAIQINLNGSDIDENKLAKKIKEVILNASRETRIRGGAI